MRLAEKYRPATLLDVVGQEAIQTLIDFVRDPYARTFMFVGPPGNGKTSAAVALGNELGADPDWDVECVTASELSIDRCRELFDRRFRFYPRGKWHLLIIEEVETLQAQVQTFLKTALERDLPKKLVVVACSNDPRLKPALIQRFGQPLYFDGATDFALPMQARMRAIWKQEAGDAPMPDGWKELGWSRPEGELEMQFSARMAMDCLETALNRVRR